MTWLRIGGKWLLALLLAGSLTACEQTESVGVGLRAVSAHSRKVQNSGSVVVNLAATRPAGSQNLVGAGSQPRSVLSMSRTGAVPAPLSRSGLRFRISATSGELETALQQDMAGEQLDGDQGQARLDGIPSGAAQITVTAIREDGSEAGSQVTMVNVVAGSTVQVSVTLIIVEVASGARPTPRVSPTPHRCGCGF